MRLLLLPLTFLLLTTQVLAQDLTICFRPAAKVELDDVTLGVLAKVEGGAELQDYLKGLVLLAAPAAGEKQVYQRQRLVERLQQLEPVLASAEFCGADTIVIERPGVTIDQQKVEKLLQRYLARHQDSLPRADISLADLQPFKPVILPLGNLKTEVYPSDPDLLKARSFNLIFSVDGRVAANLTVRARLQAWQLVAVADTELDRGDILSSSDLQWVKKDLSTLRGYLTKSELLIGKQLKRRVRRGDLLTPAMVVIPPAVKRGDTVLISLSSTAMSLTAKGTAARDGIPGDQIQVRNLDSQRNILCRVTGPGRVSVEF